MKFKFSKKNIFLVVLLLVLLFLGKSLLFAALVNGKPISRLSIVKDLEKRGGKQVLDATISKELILQEGAKKKVNIKKEEVAKKIKSIEESTKKQGQNLDQLLTLQGISRDEFNDQIYVQLILEKLLEDKIKVSDKEVADYLKNLTAQATELSSSPTPTPPSKADIKEQLRQQKLQTQAQALVEKLKKEAKISYFVNY